MPKARHANIVLARSVSRENGLRGDVDRSLPVSEDLFVLIVTPKKDKK